MMNDVPLPLLDKDNVSVYESNYVINYYKVVDSIAYIRKSESKISLKQYKNNILTFLKKAIKERKYFFSKNRIPFNIRYKLKKALDNIIAKNCLCGGKL